MNRYPKCCQYWPRRIERSNIHVKLKYSFIVLNSGYLFELIIRVSCHNQLHYTFFPIFGRILQFQPTTVTNNYRTVFRTSHNYKKQHALQIVFCAFVKIELQKNLSVLKKKNQIHSFIVIYYKLLILTFNVVTVTISIYQDQGLASKFGIHPFSCTRIEIFQLVMLM